MGALGAARASLGSTVAAGTTSLLGLLLLLLPLTRSRLTVLVEVDTTLGDDLFAGDVNGVQQHLRVRGVYDVEHLLVHVQPADRHDIVATRLGHA